MKDLKFTGIGLDNEVVFRVDSISGQGNMTVMETYGLDDRKPATVDKVKEKALLSTFKKLNYTLNDFKQFAVTNSLSLVISETDGSGVTQLAVDLVVAAPVAASTTADTTPTFSGTATPGAAISILIASTTVTATASAAGTWTVDFSVLTSGAKSALVTATKGGVSKAVTRAFTIS